MLVTDDIILAVIIGTLAAIVYSLRILVLLERRIARMDLNLEKLAIKIIKEELTIEKSLKKKPGKSKQKKTKKGKKKR